MDTLNDLLNEMTRLVESANQNQIHLRAFGGLAILTQSQKSPRFFQRESSDLDFLIPKNERHMLESFFREMGYSPDKQFNLLNGIRRQIYYYDHWQELHIDILVGDFEMCHRLPLDDRLDVHPITIPLAELLLSKAQVVQLNRKDALDIISLLINNEIGSEKEGNIDLDRIVYLCAQDWGLYKTTSMNLQRVQDLLDDAGLQITADEHAIILGRVRQIQKAFDEMPKSLAWQMRDKVGTRLRWYLEVEEVDQ